MTVDELLISLGLDTSGLTSGLSRANSEIQKFSGAASSSFNNFTDAAITNTATVAKWGAGLAAAAAVGLGAIVVQSIEAGEAVTKMAGQLGIATTTFRALADSAEDFGIEQEKLAKSFLMLESRLVDAAAGAENIKQEFFAAGLSLEQFASKGNEQRLYAIANAVANARNATERASIAQAAFGQQGIKMVEWLRQGEEAIKGQVAEFGNLHGAVTTLDFARIHEAKKALGDTKDVIETIGLAITSGLTPAILAATDEIFKLAKSGDGLKSLSREVQELSVGFAEIAGDATQGFQIIYHELMELVADLGVGGWQIVKGFSVVWQNVTQTAVRAFDVVMEAFKLIPPSFEVVGASIVVAWEFYIGKILQATEFVVRDVARSLRAIGLSDLAADADRAGDTIKEKLGKRTAEAAEMMATATGNLSAQWDKVGESLKAAVAPVDVDTSFYDDMIQGGNEIAEAHRASADAIYAEIEANNSLGESWAALVEQKAEEIDKELEQKQAAADRRLEIERNTEEMSIGLAEMGAQGRSNILDREVLARENAYGIFTKQEMANGEANAKMWEDSWRGKTAVMGNFLGQMSTLMNSENRKMFEIGKAAAIGSTIISTFESATAAFSSMAKIPFVGPVLGAAAAAAAVAGGIANVNRIRNTSFGSGSPGGGSGYTAPSAASTSLSPNMGGPGGGLNNPAATGGAQTITRQTDVNVTLVGDRFSQSQIRGLISSINDATDDNVSLRTN